MKKVNVSWAQEGTLAGQLQRSKFARWITTLEGYTKLLSYVKHDESCPRGTDDDRSCDCGLVEFLRTGL
jgi:hypothetical protein